MAANRDLRGLPGHMRDAVIGHGIDFVRVEQPDLHGVARSKLVTVEHLADIVETGLNFPLPPLALDLQCEAVGGSGYLAERGFPDTRLRLDFDSFAVLPWLPATARLIADPFHARDSAPAQAGARHVARSQVDRLAELGYQLLGGFEYEFYLLEDTAGIAAEARVRQFGSFDRADHHLIQEISRALRRLGIEVTTANLEYGPGQVEINFAPAHGLRSADDAYTFRNAIREIAAGHGRVASFMTKPAFDRSANGCHFNQSLWRDERNAFADPAERYGLSPIGRHFLAGQLAHAAALSALYAPTINCGKRFRPNSFAPISANWAIDNRTAAIRVKEAGGPGLHLENRLPTAASNPYLVLAGSIAAGLDGINRRLEPESPIGAVGHAATSQALPHRLEAALVALERDHVLLEALGPEFVQVFLAVKRHEIAKARRAITDYDTPAFLERVDPWERSEILTVL